MSKRGKKISFLTAKKMTKRVNINFNTRAGKKISFLTAKKMTKRVKIKFDE